MTDPPRRQTPGELLELRRLREMDAFRTNFLNMAAHELGTPLTPIRLQVHLLRSGALGPLDEAQVHALEIVERNAGRLAELVGEVLEVARQQSAGLRLNVQEFPLAAAIAEAVDAYREAATRIRVDLEVVEVPDLVLHTDRNRLLQVLANLLSNALKFTPPGGRVSVSAESIEGQVAVSVTDTGAGLTAGQIARLFQPFVQVHDTMNVTSPGTGLGLYICRGVLAAMGGTIDCHSRGPGLGSTFRFVVPQTATGPMVLVMATPARDEGAKAERRLRELI